MDLKTTTYPERNTALLEAAAARNTQVPAAVVEIGPGLVLKGFGTKVRRGQAVWPVIKIAESLLRRLPFPLGWYDSFETGEILDAFDPDRSGQAEVTVVDINPKPLSVLEQKHGGSVRCVKADIAGDLDDRGLAGTFDVAIAFAAIERVSVDQQGRAAGNFVGMLKTGGLVATSATELVERYGRVEPIGIEGLYRKIA